MEFPPQARGWTHTEAENEKHEAVSPAGAGMDPRRLRAGCGPRSFPRRRGDGPSPSRSRSPATSFPPQARGWTSPRARLPLTLPVSPAGAGMDRASLPSGAGAGSFPRRRGDGPPDLLPPLRRPRFPPQARGWTVRRIGIAARHSVSPAGAGMDRRGGLRRAGDRGFPRRRGDGPCRDACREARRWFPPQARGWTGLLGADRVVGRVSPAGAGMDRITRRTATTCSCFPRRRGDGPKLCGS